MGNPARTNKGFHSRTSVDQIRKAERARELKRHKRERATVRLACAKSGSQRTDNIEKLLVLERQLCGLEESKFHENVLKQKQKLLLSTFEKSRNLFAKSDKPEDKESLNRINAVLKDYYNKCLAIRREAEMLRIARETIVDDIPMPMSGEYSTLAALEPVPEGDKPRSKNRRRFDGRQALPPGVPVGMPPVLSDSEDEKIEEDNGFDENEQGHVIIPTHVSDAFISKALMPLRGAPLPPPPLPPTSFPPPPSLTSSNSSYKAQPVMFNRPRLTDATIAAQPQLRDLKSESTRMVPAQLLRPREKKSTAPVRTRRAPAPIIEGKTTEEAYDDFMKELEGLV